MAGGSQGGDLVGDHLERFCDRYRELTGLDDSVINPRAVTYFTVLSSIDVYSDLLRQDAVMAAGGTDSMNVAYISVAQPYMHGKWMADIESLTAVASR